MTSYRRMIPPPVLIPGAVDAAGLALHLSYRRRLKAKNRVEKDLVDWEDEGGSVPEPDPATH